MSAEQFFAAMCDGPVWLQTVPNPDEQGYIRSRLVSSYVEAQDFIASHDGPRQAIYFTVARLVDGADARNLNTVASAKWIWAEVDFKDHPSLTPDEILQRIVAMPLPPTFVVCSGHGFHLYWELSSPEDLTQEHGRHRISETLRLVVDYVRGDPHATDLCRMMRLPGSHNTKFGENTEVTVVLAEPREHGSYNLDDLVDQFLHDPILPEKEGAERKSKGNGSASEDPFDSFADHLGNWETIDVEERLAAMEYGSKDKNRKIHPTQLSVTASLISRGASLEDAAAIVLEATHRCMKNHPEYNKWDWAKEESDIKAMCGDWVVKRPEYAGCLSPELREQFDKVIAEGKKPKFVFPTQGRSPHVRGFNGKHTKSGTNGSGHSHAQGQHQEQPEQERQEQPKAAPGGNGKSGGGGPRATPPPQPFECFDFAKIPVREWLYGKHYIRKAATLTSARGGTGKTALALCEALAMCTGRNLLGEQPKERYRVWYFSGEEPLDELNRRVAAICIHYHIDPKELDGWLYLNSGLDQKFAIAKANGHVLLNQAAVAGLVADIGKFNIDVVTFDPLISFHHVNENSSMMDPVVKEFMGIANQCDCAVELVHHNRKLRADQEESTSADSRGSGAIIDGVRGARVLNVMSKNEAAKFGLENDPIAQELTFRVDKGKRNMTPPTHALWFRLVNIPLLNGLGAGGENGDEVQVVTRWIPPSALEGVFDDDAVAVQDMVRAGVYRQDPRAKDWVGLAVAKRCNLDPTKPAGRTKIRMILEAWFANGVLAVETRDDEQRRPRAYVIPGSWRRTL